VGEDLDSVQGQAGKEFLFAGNDDLSQSARHSLEGLFCD
jgi:hypothetical protein